MRKPSVVKGGDASGKHTPQRLRVPRQWWDEICWFIRGQGQDTATAPAQVPKERIVVGK